MITEEMTSLQSSTNERRDKEVQKQEDILIYIHTLEERIKQLEDTQSVGRSRNLRTPRRLLGAHLA